MSRTVFDGTGNPHTIDDDEPDFMEDFRKMQEKLPLIEKDTKAFNYKYAPLEAILDKWNPVFKKYNFVLMQSTTAGTDGESDVVCTKLHHWPTCKSIDSSLTLQVSDDYQKVGSGITYYRRYTLITVCGQQPVGEDFDGLKSHPNDRPKPKATKKKSIKAAKEKSPKAEEAQGDVGWTPLPVVSFEGLDDAGVHIAYESFAKDAESVDALNNFYRKNRDAINKLSDAKQKKIIDVFYERKIEIQKGSN
tara:strand:+ start:10945 stop:11688 length:744 start_codon:yes stop_codon:yes gene_type:complete